MDPRTDRSHVRLAELVAALSLGIDLGFGQPMEHVLRQCLIALRIAERVELPEEERAAIYYSALLVNVGCHADAHEQAKWFGDDIALKSTKFASYDMRSLRSSLATMRRIGAGNQPLHRLRVALEFVVSGHRELDSMIETLVKDGRIELRNFGVFKVKKRKSRQGRNPRTGEKVLVPERTVVTFKAGEEMEERVRQSHRH